MISSLAVSTPSTVFKSASRTHIKMSVALEHFLISLTPANYSFVNLGRLPHFQIIGLRLGIFQSRTWYTILNLDSKLRHFYWKVLHKVELRLFNVVEFKPEGSMEALPGEIGGLQDEMIDSDTKGNQEVVPLEKDKSNHIPPIITPSEEVVKATTSSQHMGSVLNAAHGNYKPLLPPWHSLHLNKDRNMWTTCLTPCSLNYASATPLRQLTQKLCNIVATKYHLYSCD